MKEAIRPATRKTRATFRDRGKERAIIVTVYPDGTLGLRLEYQRQEETIAASTIYSIAVQRRVAEESRLKKAKKKDNTT